MKVEIKNNKIVLSNNPAQNVPGALYIIYKQKEKVEETLIDVKRGCKEYELPKGVDKKDIESLYLRVL